MRKMRKVMMYRRGIALVSTCVMFAAIASGQAPAALDRRQLRIDRFEVEQ